MERRDAEMLITHIFQLEQELMRGTWDEEEGARKLIEFVKGFDKSVEQAERLNTTSGGSQ